MSTEPARRGSYQGSRPRTTLELRQWHDHACGEGALEPGLPIVDAHHHIYGAPADTHHYLIEDFERDISGHRIIGTICVEAYRWGWRETGPECLRPVGEVELLAALTREPRQIRSGLCQIGAAIVGSADLTLGGEVAGALAALVDAGQGRLRGIRQVAACDNGLVGQFIKHRPAPNLLRDPAFRKGFALLHHLGLSFDAWIFHHQLDDLIDLADVFPQTRIVLGHVGGVIGVGEYLSHRESVLARWGRDLQRLAAKPNVFVKIGGLGMAMFGFGFEHQKWPATSAELARAWAPFIATCIDAFGPQRCMFESNFPVDKQSCGYNELWNAFKLVTRYLDAADRCDLFYRTACRTYRLPELEAAADRAATA